MSPTSEFILHASLIGVGATIVMDLWALLLKPLGVPSLNLAFLGRWIGHLPRGQWTHESIAKASPIKGELRMGGLLTIQLELPSRHFYSPCTDWSGHESQLCSLRSSLES
jgi:hypothetical protein